jgi:1-aminocyclopropane-1-carboxylate deaminase
MNELYEKENLPTDIVYTSKLVYAAKDLCANNYLTAENKVLLIHSGGLQGNLSLPANTLKF